MMITQTVLTVVLALGLLAEPFTAAAQQTRKLPTISVSSGRRRA